LPHNVRLYWDGNEADQRKGECAMIELQTKLARDLEPGDTVLDDDGRAVTVREKWRGFVTFEHKGRPAKSIGIDWTNGEWSQIPATQLCHLA
jgi:hypothetical protein